MPPDDDALGATLLARGFALAESEDLPQAPGGLGWDAIVWLAGERQASALPSSLAALRSALGERGQLCIVARFGKPSEPGTLDPRVVTIALSEHGFVVLRQQWLSSHEVRAGNQLWTARRDAFRVREYRPGDEAQILPIFEGSFFVHRSLERWSWAYRENPYGNLYISEAFAENGQLVAHYAGFPVRFRIPGHAEPVTALHIGDTMTLPGVRHVGRGPTSLLGRTVRHFYARFCDGRVAFNYGVNTGNIQRFSMAFVGAQRLEDLPFHVLQLPAPGLAAVAGRRWKPELLARLGGWRCQRVERFGGSFDDLMARAQNGYGMLVERDARYLDWRYRRQPGNEYRIYACQRRGRLAGWAVFRRRDDTLIWGDALFDPRHQHAVTRLLAFALTQPENVGITSVETWAGSRPGWWQPLLRSVGFEARPEPRGLGLVFVPFDLDPGEPMRASLYYTMGDSDLF